MRINRRARRKTCTRDARSSRVGKRNWMEAFYKDVPGQPNVLRCSLGHLIPLSNHRSTNNMRLRRHLFSSKCGWLNTQAARDLDRPSVQQAIAKWNVADETDDTDDGEAEEEEQEEELCAPRLSRTCPKKMSLSALLESDKIREGDRVRAKSNLDVAGAITADGRILYKGKTFAPTPFSKFITEETTGIKVAAVRSGWDEVFCRGKTLRELLTASQKSRALSSGTTRQPAGNSKVHLRKGKSKANGKTSQEDPDARPRRGRPPKNSKRPNKVNAGVREHQDAATEHDCRNGSDLLTKAVPKRKRSPRAINDPRDRLIDDSSPIIKRSKSCQSEEPEIHSKTCRWGTGLPREVSLQQQQPRGNAWDASAQQTKTQGQPIVVLSDTESEEGDSHHREEQEVESDEFEGEADSEDEGQEEEVEQDEAAFLDTLHGDDVEDPSDFIEDEDLSFEAPSDSYIVLCKKCYCLLTDSTAVVGSLASLDMHVFSGAKLPLSEAKPKLIRQPLYEARSLSCGCGASLGLRFGNPEGPHAAIADCYGLYKSSVMRHCLGDLGSKCDYTKPRASPTNTMQADQDTESAVPVERTQPSTEHVAQTTSNTASGSQVYELKELLARALEATGQLSAHQKQSALSAEHPHGASNMQQV